MTTTVRLLQDQHVGGYPFKAGSLLDIDDAESAWRVGGGLADDDANSISQAQSEGYVVISLDAFSAKKERQKAGSITQAISNNPNLYSDFDDELLPVAKERGLGPIWIGGKQYWSTSKGYIGIAGYVQDQSKFKNIHQRIANAYRDGDAVNYIVTGDSTRNQPYEDAFSISVEHYKFLFNMLGAGVVVEKNCRGGMDSVEWLNNSLTESFNQCVGFISGTGKNSIVEYSLFLNDWDGVKSYQTIKADILAALNALIAAKPDVAILLACPIKTDDESRNQAGVQMYREISDELNLPMMDCYEVTRPLHGDVKWYSTQTFPQVLNGTHLNEFGMKVLVNVIVKQCVPDFIRELIIFPEFGQINGTAKIMPIGNRWNISTGVNEVSANYLAFEKIAIPEGTNTLLVEHQGNREDVLVFDKDGNFIITIFFTSTLSQTRFAIMPNNARFVTANIDNSGAYDASNDSLSFTYMSVEEMNAGQLFAEHYML